MTDRRLRKMFTTSRFCHDSTAYAGTQVLEDDRPTPTPQGLAFELEERDDGEEHESRDGGLSAKGGFGPCACRPVHLYVTDNETAGCSGWGYFRYSNAGVGVEKLRQR